MGIFSRFNFIYNDTHSLSKDEGNKHAASALSILVNYRLNVSCAELNPHTVADAFYNGELENEIRLLATTSDTVNLSDFTFRKDSDREAIMEKIESIRSQTIYHHHLIIFFCQGSSTIAVIQMPRCGDSKNIIMYFFVVGCGTLWVTDGIWKLTFPHCMHRVKVLALT